MMQHILRTILCIGIAIASPNAAAQLSTSGHSAISTEPLRGFASDSDSDSGNSSDQSSDSQSSDQSSDSQSSEQSSDSQSSEQSSDSQSSEQSSDSQSSEQSSGSQSSDSQSSESSGSNSDTSQSNSSESSQSSESIASNSGDTNSGNSRSGTADSRSHSHSQDDTTPEPQPEERNAGIPIVFPLTGTTFVGATIGLVVFIAVRASKPQVAPQPLAVYLRQNMLAFETDVGAGAGPVLIDLAQLLGISDQNHAEFAKILHAHFEELRTLVHRIPRDPDAGAAFRDAVYDALRASPSFTRDLLRNGALAFELGIGVPGQRFSIN